MSGRFVEAALLAARYDPGDRESNAFYRERILPLEYDSLLDVAGVDVSAHAAAGEDRWQEDGVAALIRFDNGHSGVLVAARDAGGWSEKLDAYGDGASANVTAPDRISITRPEGTTVREMSPEASGWATATQRFGFAVAVHHFLDRVRNRGTPLTSGMTRRRPSSSSIASSLSLGSPRRSNPDGSGAATPRSDGDDPTSFRASPIR